MNEELIKRVKRFKLTCKIKIGDKDRSFCEGHEYVDLLLPSGLLWATCNVGASKETDFGDYYMYAFGSKNIIPKIFVII